ncbi:sporulation membrane protein YtaF [Alicyclobacillus sp. SO9]|uniref:sporulation membrane protein YtaF n=1 Tax=Alicyclobacillus sp. SO9 TaxID=2665646 RepID=UPI0018E8E4B0|nr:sporulation membrane protein YtaF [Alicyclobacillus sp. SO9]QQE79378.1 sporulation membrane protein YtaF [Alicyclobacillus sp. SO9]
MSGVLTVLAIAIASNLDNAGVGIAYGVRKIHFSWWANLTISSISGLTTYIAGVTGSALTRYVPGSFAKILGAIVMMLVGIWVLLEPWREQRTQEKENANVVTQILRDPVYADFDKSSSISFKEALVLGVALSLNALAGGFDAGIVHIGVIWTAAAVALASAGLLELSAYIGEHYASRVFGKRATYIAGLLLFLVGVFQIW